MFLYYDRGAVHRRTFFYNDPRRFTSHNILSSKRIIDENKKLYYNILARYYG